MYLGKLLILALPVTGNRILSVVFIPAILLLASIVEAAGPAGVDPLGEPAQEVDLRVPAPVISVERAGEALFSVGPHGLIRRSLDNGQSWQQMPSPVASDLVQVRFRDALHGWIVGHDSVLLHTADGGESWKVQLDGRSLLSVLQQVYGQRADNGDEEAEAMLREVNLAVATSATADIIATPFLDVLFDAHGQGFVVGAFGMILRSDDDGESWEPWIERTENDRRMHLYALAEHDDTFYASGEQGLLMRLDSQGQRFRVLETPYGGSYFGVGTFGDLLMVYGLRGNLFASRDGGESWEQVETGLSASLVSVLMQGEELIVISQDGKIMALDKNSLQTIALRAKHLGEVFAASESGRRGVLVVASLAGPRVVEIVRVD